MAFVTGNKLYMIVDTVNELIVCATNFGFGYDSETQSEPVPEVDAGNEAVHVSAATLGGLSYQEFMNKKKPVIVGGAFDSWADRSPAPTLVLQGGTNPREDGAVVATVNVSGAPASSPFVVSCSNTHLSNSLSGSSGTTDGSGAASFNLKAWGGGEQVARVSVLPDGHQDFEPAYINVTIDKSPF